MKQIYLTLLTLLMATSGLMAKSITAKKSDDWGLTTTWTTSSTPASGDSIIIPVNDTVTLTANYNLNGVVIIINGVLDLNNGKLKLDAASKVIINNGKLIGHGNNDQLQIGSDFKFKGAGTVTGYSYADDTTGSGFLSFSPLPVTFQAFYVTRQGSNSQLSWSTSEEVNNGYYAVEKSSDGRNWKQVAVVMGAGTSALVNKYSYTDKNITDAVVYYRIRQVDMSGSAFYSAIRSLRLGNSTITNIYASSNKTVTIDFNSDVKDNVSIQLVNMSGQVIVRKQFNQASYRLIVDAMSAGSGVYAVQVSDGKGWSEVKKIAL